MPKLCRDNYICTCMKLNLSPTSITKYKLFTNAVLFHKASIFGNYSKIRQSIQPENESKLTAKMKLKKYQNLYLPRID